MTGTSNLILFCFWFICNIISNYYTDLYCQTLDDGNPSVNFEHFTVENGLSQSHVTFIFQDSKGFIWIGTQDGLNRYDGYTFRIFRHSPSDNSSLSSSYILTIFEDKKENLWIGTNGGGLNLFIPETESFIRFEADKSKENWLGNRVINSITEDSSGYLWLATGWGGTDNEGGLYRFDPAKRRFKAYFTTYHQDSDFMTCVLQPYNQQYVWTAGIHGLFLFDKKKEDFVYSSPEENNGQITAGDVRCITEGPEGEIWLATSGNIKAFNPYSKEYRLVFPAKNEYYLIQYLTFQDSATLWFGTRSAGLIRYELSTSSFTSFSNVQANSGTISNNDIRAILIDKNRNIWAGGLFGGLNKFKPTPGWFSTFNIKNTKGNLVNDLLSFYQENDSVIWLGSFTEGLIKYNMKSKYYTTFKYNHFHNSIIQNTVWSILKDKDGCIWAVTTIGLSRYDENKNYFENYNKFVDRFGKRIKSSQKPILVEGSKKDIYLLLSEEIFKYDYKCRNFIPSNVLHQLEDKFYYKPSANIYFPYSVVVMEGGTEGRYSLCNQQPPFSFTEINEKLNRFREQVKYIYREKDSEWLLIGDKGSLYSLNKTDGIVPMNLRIPPDDLRYVTSDGEKCIWFVTAYSGIFRVNPDETSMEIFNSEQGYPFESIGSAVSDNDGNLWVSLSGGLARINTESKIINLFSAKDGLLVNDKRRIYKGMNGRLFLGLNSYDPGSIILEKKPPDIVITSLQIHDRLFNTAECSVKDRVLSLGSDDDYIRIEFASLDFSSPELNLYAYKLDGFDRYWINAGRQHFAQYTNLDPGLYTFKVRGTDSEGIWNEQGASLKIFIPAPWWKTTTAYVLYFLLIAGTVLFFWRMQLRRIRVRHEYMLRDIESEKLQELDELKTRFFSNISHEFRTPLTLILGPAKQIIEQSGDEIIKEKAKLINRNAKKLSNLANQLLELTRIEAGKMKLELSFQDLIPLMNDLIKSFQSFAESKNISLRLNSNKDSCFVYLDNDKFDKILSNLLSNALKFTPNNGFVSVTIKSSEEIVEIAVTDNGTGIPPEQIERIFDRFYQVENRTSGDLEGSGIGLSLTKELVELHKGTITVSSIEGKGSTFRIMLPMGRNKYFSSEIKDSTSSVSEIINVQKTKTEKEEILLSSEKTQTETIEHIYLNDQSRLSLLIVEDNAELRDYISGILTDKYNVYSEGDGLKGLNTAIEKIPDLIISDIMMPGIDGFDLCKKLKSDQRTSHIPLILLTAKATMNDKISGLEAGADSYIMKPFEASELKARIRNLILQRERIHTHFQNKGLFEIDKERVNAVDRQFLSRTAAIIKEHLGETSLDIEYLAENLGVSRSLLHKKLKALTGESPGELIRRYRLRKAAVLIEHKFGNMTEIAYEVGFNDPSYFTKCFKRQFGVSPSEYLVKKDGSYQNEISSKDGI